MSYFTKLRKTICFSHFIIVNIISIFIIVNIISIFIIINIISIDKKSSVSTELMI